MRQIISGIQPTGELHLGNYFGAIQQHLKIDPLDKGLFFIADYHALTSVRDPRLVKQYTYDVAAAYLALGLPSNAVLFRQSDVPFTTELMWLLSAVTNLGLLQRAPAYKEKTEKGIPASVGLFTYPLLMAADILLFNADVVPVGQDQLPHIDIARDIAQAFNAIYGTILKVPKPQLTTTPKVLGIDGQKMAKSYNNTVPIFADVKRVSKIIKSITTTSVDYTQEPMNPDGDIVFNLYCLLSPENEATMRHAYLEDRKFGYGHAKQALIDAHQKTFGQAYEKFKDLRANEQFLEVTLQCNGKIAWRTANKTMIAVRKAMGLPECP